MGEAWVIAGRAIVRRELSEPPLEQSSLGVVGGQPERAAVGVAGLRRAAETPQQLPRVACR